MLKTVPSVYIFLFTVQSLQCYFCQSAVSIEECSSRQLKITCHSDLKEPVCAEVKIKAITNGGKETYVYTRGKVLLLNKQCLISEYGKTYCTDQFLNRTKIFDELTLEIIFCLMALIHPLQKS